MNTRAIFFVTILLFFLLPVFASEIDSSAPPPIPHYKRNVIKIHSFSRQKEDAEVSWVAVTAERKVVELFANAQVMVASHLIQSPSSLIPKYSIKGTVSKKDDILTVAIILSDKKGENIAKGTINGTIGFFKRIRNVIGETVIYALDINEKLEKRDTANKPTNSNNAYALYLLARQKVLAEQSESSLSLLFETVKEDPEFAMAYWTISQIYHDKENKDSAIVWNNKAIEIDSTHPRWPYADSIDKDQPLRHLLHVSKRQTFEAIDSGLSYKYTELEHYGFCAIIWCVDPKLFTIDIEIQNTTTGNYIKEFFRDKRTVLAINAGFFEIDGKYNLSPSGLIISNGKLIFPVTDHGGSGVFCLKNGMPEIKWAKETLNPAEYELAFQCGPVIVERGGTLGVHNNNYRRLNRAAIGISDEKIIIAIVIGEKNNGLSLYEFAQYLSSSKENGGAGCDIALNLDGGSSTQARFVHQGFIININGLWAINSAVVVKKNKL